MVTAREADGTDGLASSPTATLGPGLTVAGFLELPVTARGLPVVVAGAQGLDRPLRWVHVSELSDVEGLFRPGDLLLTTGVWISSSAPDIESYVGRLRDQDVAGLVLELGRRFDTAPEPLVRACERARLPLITLRREVPFVEVTEAVQVELLHERNALRELLARAHERFTELTLGEASSSEIVAAAADLCQGQVVFSDSRGHVLAVGGDDVPVELLLGRWGRRAGAEVTVQQTRIDAASGTARSPVRLRGRDYGELTLLAAASPGPGQVGVLERAAAALSMGLLAGSDEGVLGSHRSVLLDIMRGRFGSADAIHARSAALGQSTRDRRYHPVVLVGVGADVGASVDAVARELRIGVLHSRFAPDRWAALLLVEPGRNGLAAETFAERLTDRLRAEQPGLVVALGPDEDDLTRVGDGFREAGDVGEAAGAGSGRIRGLPWYRIRDVRLRGLLHMLRTDRRVRAFSEGTLGALLERDARDGGELVATLTEFLRLGGNKSLAAEALAISRPTLYERLGRIQRLLRADLDDPEECASLFAAIMVTQNRGGQQAQR